MLVVHVNGDAPPVADAVAERGAEMGLSVLINFGSTPIKLAAFLRIYMHIL